MFNKCISLPKINTKKIGKKEKEKYNGEKPWNKFNEKNDRDWCYRNQSDADKIAKELKKKRLEGPNPQQTESEIEILLSPRKRWMGYLYTLHCDTMDRCVK